MAPRSSFVRPCSGASSVLRGSQTPCSVHRWLASLDFPSRPTAPSAAGGLQGLPVLAHGASTHARGLFDRARPLRTSPFSVQQVSPSTSGNSLGAWKFNSISRLNTRPACAPVNASGTPSRPCPHDSGSSWVASPSMCDFLLRYTLPVYPGASPNTSCPRSCGGSRYVARYCYAVSLRLAPASFVLEGLRPSKPPQRGRGRSAPRTPRAGGRAPAGATL